MSLLERTPLFVQDGIVERGTKAANVIGFPTANIRFGAPGVSGTYAGKVLVESDEYAAAIYANRKRRLLEAHLLDFSGDLYGKRITVILLARLAEEKAFLDVQDQRRFIGWAVAEVRKYFDKMQ